MSTKASVQGTACPGLLVELAVDRDRLGRPVADVALGQRKAYVRPCFPPRGGFDIGLESIRLAGRRDGENDGNLVFRFFRIGQAEAGRSTGSGSLRKVSDRRSSEGRTV